MTTPTTETVSIMPEVLVPADSAERVTALIEQGRALQAQVDAWARECLVIFGPKQVQTWLLGIDLEDFYEEVMPGVNELFMIGWRIEALALAAGADASDKTTVPWFEKWEREVLWPAQVAHLATRPEDRERLEQMLARDVCPACEATIHPRIETLATHECIEGHTDRWPTI